MKKIIYLFFCLFPLFAYSQRYETSSNVNISGGILKNGYNVSLGYEKYLSFNSAIIADVNYLSRTKKISTLSKDMELETYTLGGRYRYYTTLGSLFPFVGMGFYGGYERFINKKEYSNLIEIKHETGFIYGFSSDIGIEYNMRAISINIMASPMYELNNKVFLVPIKAGVKYFF